MNRLELLTTSEMATADRLAVESGAPSLTLMENAGRAVADEVARRWPRVDRIAILCGPGNNGGDGYVAARLLTQKGYSVRLGSLVDIETLKGDAAEMARRWNGRVERAEPAIWRDADLIIDALFGAGLSRPLEGEAASLVGALNESGLPVVAVDIPSGIHGDTGDVMGAAVQARSTVTFFRLKAGHLLLPGRTCAGEIQVEDIGIPDEVLSEIKPKAWRNAPALWLGDYPWPRSDGHKYGRGHAVVVSGPPERTGAARMGARAALRVGAGLVTVACGEAAMAVNAAHLTAIMLTRSEGADGLAAVLADARNNAVLIGPGTGIGEGTRAMARAAAASKAALVLDADALTSFEDRTESLFEILRAREAPAVMTPHDGEFSRLFPDLKDHPKLERTRAAAGRSGAVVVLKGADTVIAAPDERAAINDHASPWLATAGAGDVLGGLILGLLAQRMPAFLAAAAAVWLHGEAARCVGPGLIAEDLPEALPAALRTLRQIEDA